MSVIDRTMCSLFCLARITAPPSGSTSNNSSPPNEKPPRQPPQNHPTPPKAKPPEQHEYAFGQLLCTQRSHRRSLNFEKENNKCDLGCVEVSLSVVPSTNTNRLSSPNTKWTYAKIIHGGRSRENEKKNIAILQNKSECLWKLADGRAA